MHLESKPTALWETEYSILWQGVKYFFSVENTNKFIKNPNNVVLRFFSLIYVSLLLYISTEKDIDHGDIQVGKLTNPRRGEILIFATV